MFIEVPKVKSFSDGVCNNKSSFYIVFKESTVIKFSIFKYDINVNTVK